MAVDGCPGFEVTNGTKDAATFTITFQVVTESGEAWTSAEQIVRAVAPGRTVRVAVEPTGPTEAADGGAHVRIIEARSVPTVEGPSTAGPCPASGVRLYADDGDAAMGLRVVGLHLVNCGTRTYGLDGYPQVRLLDDRHGPVDGVAVLHGGDAIAMGTGADGPPRPLELKPGQSAHAGLVWRNTTGLGSDPVTVPYVRVVPRSGAAAVMVTPDLDLGTTGKLGVGPWKAD